MLALQRPWLRLCCALHCEAEAPLLQAALRYMVYGKSQTFDVERLVDLLQALEKFVAVRDTGDGTAYKVDGVRGGVYVGQAGDARGTKALKDEDGATARSALDAYRAERDSLFSRSILP